MPYNLSDPTQRQAFTQHALSQGATQADLDSFLASQSATPVTPPSAPAQSAPQIQDPNPMVLPTMPKAQGVLPTPDALMPGVQGDTSLIQAAQQKHDAQQIQNQPQQQAAPQSAPQQAPYNPAGKTDQQILAETGHQSSLDTLGKNGVDLSKPSVAPQIQSPPLSPQSQPVSPSLPTQPQHTPQQLGTQNGILPGKYPVTQVYGQRSQYDVFSKNISPAYELGTPKDTPLATPPGQWKVVSAYAGAQPNTGHIGNFQGQGWGNNVRLQNVQNGDTIGFNHMNGVNVQPGQIIGGNQVVGRTGFTGNATGPHLAVTYQDQYGRPRDFARSPYAQYLTGGQ